MPTHRTFTLVLLSTIIVVYLRKKSELAFASYLVETLLNLARVITR